MKLLEKFISYCNKKLLIKKNDSILLGISGGPDSLTMLDLFSRVQREFNLQLYVFHLNHMFRKEAAAEADFVAEVCKKYNMKVFIEEYDVPSLIKEEGLSPEEAAREARFKLMKEKASSLNLSKIALAHNRDDHIETILFHIFRGTALKGLSGINPITDYQGLVIIHPLLNINSYEIEKYCQRLDFEPRRDPTNEKTIYTRNKIRHKIIPYIEDEINPGFRDVIVRMASILKEEEEFLSEMAAKEMKDSLIARDKNKIILSLKHLQSLSSVIRRRIIQQVINQIQGQITDLYYEHLNTVDDFITGGNTGKRLYLPAEIRVKRVYNKLIIKKGNFDKKEYKYNIQLGIPALIELPGNKKIKTGIIKKDCNWLNMADRDEICLCDYKKIEEPLYVRTRRPGDKFQPLGMKGMKKLKDYFMDEKISPVKRDEIPVIIDAQQRIVWITGMRMNEKFKVTDETDEILKITIE